MGSLAMAAFAAGIRATELRPGRDRGTSLITGVSEAQFELLRWFFVEVDDDTGYDAAADVIARAVSCTHDAETTRSLPGPSGCNVSGPGLARRSTARCGCVRYR